MGREPVEGLWVPNDSDLFKARYLWITYFDFDADLLTSIGEPAIALIESPTLSPDMASYVLTLAPELEEVRIWPPAYQSECRRWSQTVAYLMTPLVRRILVVLPRRGWSKGQSVERLLAPRIQQTSWEMRTLTSRERNEARNLLQTQVVDSGALQPSIALRPPSATELEPVDARDVVPAPDTREHLVERLIRRGTVVGLAAFEGTGKSWWRTQLGLSVALGEDVFLGQYPIPSAASVLVVDMENGPVEEGQRREKILTGMGRTRDDIPKGVYVTVSFPDVDLDTIDGRERLRELVFEQDPELLILDSGTSLVDDEVGARLKPVMRYLKRWAYETGMAILVILHLVKPMRDPRRKSAAQSRRLADVAGNWTKSLDVVAVLSEQDRDDTLRLDVRKRTDPSSYIIKQQGGLWVAVAAIRESESGTMPKVDETILGDVLGRRAVTRSALVELHAREKGYSKANVCKCVARLIGEGFLTEAEVGQGEKTLRLTEDGERRLRDAHAEGEVPLDEL